MIIYVAVTYQEGLELEVPYAQGHHWGRVPVAGDRLTVGRSGGEALILDVAGVEFPLDGASPVVLCKVGWSGPDHDDQATLREEGFATASYVRRLPSFNRAGPA